MTDDDLPRFEEGDVVEVRGTRYTVEQADLIPRKDRVLQYRLEGAADESHAILSPERGKNGSAFVIQEFHEVDPDGVVKE